MIWPASRSTMPPITCPMTRAAPRQVHVEHLFDLVSVPFRRLDQRGKPGEEHQPVDLAHLLGRLLDAVAVGDVHRHDMGAPRQLGAARSRSRSPDRADRISSAPARLIFIASARPSPLGRAHQPISFPAPLAHVVSFQVVSGCPPSGRGVVASTAIAPSFRTQGTQRVKIGQKRKRAFRVLGPRPEPCRVQRRKQQDRGQRKRPLWTRRPRGRRPPRPRARWSPSGARKARAEARNRRRAPRPRQGRSARRRSCSPGPSVRTREKEAMASAMAESSMGRGP